MSPPAEIFLRKLLRFCLSRLAIANELLHGGNVFRVEQVGQEPQPMGGLWGFWVIFDRGTIKAII